MILDDIVQVKKVELKKAKQIRKIVELKAKARNAAPLKPFDLRQRDAVSIIAEIKRASPVKGVFKADLDPAGQAVKYKEGGARAISVLTDEQFFKGSVDDLRAARNAAGIPILRKDFVIDEYQLWEARVMLADAALLIVRILDKAQLRDYIALAREELKLATLVEVEQPGLGIEIGQHHDGDLDHAGRVHWIVGIDGDFAPRRHMDRVHAGPRSQGGQTGADEFLERAGFRCRDRPREQGEKPGQSKTAKSEASHRVAPPG
jgi:hypothetical protein